MRVFVAGASGAIGRQLVPLLLDAGHSVAGLARSSSSADVLRAAGVEPVEGDALDRESTIAAVRSAAPDAIVHQLTAIPDRLNPRAIQKQFAATNRLRREGTANLIAGASAAGISRFVAQSVAFAYVPEGPRVLDEDAALNLRGGGEIVSAVADMERQVTAFGGVVLRYGWFYGPGTAYSRDGQTGRMVRRRAFPIVGRGTGVFSFIHVRDAAEATVAALDADGPEIFNIVDNEPAPVAEWLAAYAEALDAKPPIQVPAWLGRIAVGKYSATSLLEGRGASNARAREQLGWTPSHATWREGFKELAG